jgi:peptidoglycan/LPS O-acetylase OafA/YrhL
MKNLLWPGLGAARFILAAVVAVSHTLWFIESYDPFWYFFYASSSVCAVFCFLVISGFSIASSYERERKGFYGRRALRILPLYFLSVAFSAFCTLPFGGIVEAKGATYLAPAWPQVLANTIFLQGFTHPTIATNGPLWSLSVEVLFYLATPLLARLSNEMLAVVIAAATIIYISAAKISVYYSGMLFGSAFPLLAWAWLCGFLAYRLKNLQAASLLIVSIMVFAFTFNPYALQPRWPILPIIIGLAIGFLGRINGSRSMGNFMNLLGDLSYPLYLFHYPLYILLYAAGLRLAACMLFLTALTLAFALEFLFERPIKHAIRKMLARCLNGERQTVMESNRQPASNG